MRYTGTQLREIVFPLGGIGTGSIGLSGNGAFVDREIFNRPNKGSVSPYTFFAIRADFPDGRRVTKVLQGDHLKDFMGKYSKTTYDGYGNGPDGTTLCGLPHFEKVVFDGTFPMAKLTFTDKNFPAKVILTAFNPLIPLDADNSGLPSAFFDIKIQSLEENVQYTLVFSMHNPFPKGKNRKVSMDGCTAVQMTHHGVDPSCKDYGDLTIAVAEEDGICQQYWYRGRWTDALTTFWHDLTHDTLNDRVYEEPASSDVCTVGLRRAIAKGSARSFRFLFAWNIPNNYNYWDPVKDEQGEDVLWKNYYATQFADSVATATYCFKNWDALYGKTRRFCAALHGASLDKAVIDAVSSTLSVLKSPTVLRLEDGSFYGWEGLMEEIGSCEGSCNHVWSYVYSLCFLFPELERSLRNTEFKQDLHPTGALDARTALPLGRPNTKQPTCMDGQLATVIKIYRDWKLTGNTQWVQDNWENIQKIMDYAWSEENPNAWDRDKDGVLEGLQHHTLDMELFGPSAWLEGLYLAALRAAGEIAGFLGDVQKQEQYNTLFQKGYAYTKENLFNGRYFIHMIDLEDKSCTERFQCPAYWNEENGQLKYQIGEGCQIDQLLGQWHANLCGLGDIFDPDQRKIALKSMLQYNFKPSLRDFANTWRIFALNDESGTVICEYPEDAKKPIIPIPYCQECMTGFEYAFAGLLISEGFIKEGLQVVAAVRNRYDGARRNPWNEMEAGSNYARSMASFALLPIFSGFSYDLPHDHIGFAPILEGDFRCPWFVGTGWGEYAQKENSVKLTVLDGALQISSLTLGGISQVSQVLADGKPIAFTFEDHVLRFRLTTIKKHLKIS